MNQFHIFETAIGWAGVAWGDMADGSRGLIAAHLPEADPALARRSFARRVPDASETCSPPPDMESVIDAIRALMRGEKADLSSVPLDIARVPEFNAKVYAIARAIPPGRTMTYGEIALELGDRLLARDVGAALGKNPWPIVVPCHRVTAAGGKLGGFSARGGADTKLRLLEIEGAEAASIARADQAKAAQKAARKAGPAPQADLFGKR
jgi:methylated-DNA-[protein]-cysteine S-methyltransferase